MVHLYHCCPTELSALMGMFSLCVIQYGSPRDTLTTGNGASAIEEHILFHFNYLNLSSLMWLAS